MLDMTKPPVPSPAWQTALASGDVVLFRFPHSEPDGPTVPKSRPTLVLDVTLRDCRIFASLAFGTSADTDANRGEEIPVETPEGMEAAGVRRATRFVCARRIEVPLDHVGWDVNPSHGSPIIGHLDPVLRARMDVIRERIARLRARAEEHRHGRHRFTVERRRNRRTIGGSPRPPRTVTTGSRDDG